MKVLIGTTNLSKVKRFKALLEGYDIEFYLLSELGIVGEPEEKGSTPEQNAAIKAEYYGKYFDRVICGDSGLYFDALPLDDERQPGLRIRTPMGRARLGEEEMIEYYRGLVSSLGGKVLAFYLDGVAVFNNGKIYSFMEGTSTAMASAFYMVDKPSEKRHIGWPLDSISVNRTTGKYFTHEDTSETSDEENIMLGEYKERLVLFLKDALGIED